MRYPEWNETRVDTGLRLIDIMHVYGQKDIERIGGQYAVTQNIITRILSAATTEGDSGSDKPPILFAGTLDECLDYVAHYTLPINSRLQYFAPGKIIYADIDQERLYIDTLTPLCNDGYLLGKMLNYAAVVRKSYSPYMPGYDPDKRPVV